MARKKQAPPVAPAAEHRRIPLADIVVDPEGVQARAVMDDEAVGDYAAAMQAGVAFPPVDVFEGPDGIVLSDGFHRFDAALQVGAGDIECEVRPGSKRDAALYACGANATHRAIRRTNADKRKAVGRLLLDAEWMQWSDRQIAEAVGVSNTFVSALRREVSTDDNSARCARRKGRDGKTYKARKPRKPAPKAKPAEPEPRQPEPATEPAKRAAEAEERARQAESNFTAMQARFFQAHSELTALKAQAAQANSAGNTQPVEPATEPEVKAEPEHDGGLGTLWSIASDEERARFVEAHRAELLKVLGRDSDGGATRPEASPEDEGGITPEALAAMQADPVVDEAPEPVANPAKIFIHEMRPKAAALAARDILIETGELKSDIPSRPSDAAFAQEQIKKRGKDGAIKFAREVIATVSKRWRPADC